MEGIKEIWDFIQYQVLGMKWLNLLVGNLLNKAGLDTETRLGGVLHFLYMIL